MRHKWEFVFKNPNNVLGTYKISMKVCAYLFYLGSIFLDYSKYTMY